MALTLPKNVHWTFFGFRGVQIWRFAGDLFIFCYCPGVGAGGGVEDCAHVGYCGGGGAETCDLHQQCRCRIPPNAFHQCWLDGWIVLVFFLIKLIYLAIRITNWSYKSQISNQF